MDKLRWLLGVPIVKLVTWLILAAVLVAIATGIVLYAGDRFGRQVQGKTFDEILHAIETGALAVAAVQIIVLYGLGRTEAKWRKLLSYHQFFSDCPAKDHRARLMEVMSGSEFDQTFRGAGTSLTTTQARNIYNNAAHLQIVKLYLDGFEQLAVAIRCRVVDEQYAFHIEATRVVRAFKIFRPIIQIMQEANPAAYIQFVTVAEAWTQRKLSEKTKQEAITRKLQDKLAKLPAAD